MAQSEDDLASQRREEVSKAVIAKTNAEATKVVEKANAESQSYTFEVLEGSDGKLSSRMNSQVEQLKKSIQAIFSTQQRLTNHRGRESKYVARHHVMRE